MKPEASVLILLIAMFAGTASINPFFISGGNLMLIAQFAPIYAILAIGAMMNLIVGGIDLSAGALITGSNVLVAVLVVWYRVDLTIAILAVLAIGIAMGLGEGLISVTFSPPFPYVAPSLIVSLALSYIIPGYMMVITRAFPIWGLPDVYRIIGQSKVLGLIPMPLVIFLMVFFITAYILHFSVLGRHMYAIGGDPEAARRAGVNVRRVRVFCFAYSAFLFSLTGIILGSIVFSGTIHLGPGYMLSSIIGAILGGVSLAGGEGTVVGALLGALVVDVIDNILVALGVSPFWRDVVVGIIFFVVVISDFARRKKSLLP